jgi:hypothetical protein
MFILYVIDTPLILWTVTLVQLELFLWPGNETCYIIDIFLEVFMYFGVIVLRIWAYILTVDYIFIIILIFFFRMQRVLIRTVVFPFVTRDSFLTLFTFIISTFGYASVSRNSITTIDSSNLERIKRNISVRCHNIFFKIFDISMIIY